MTLADGTEIVHSHLITEGADRKVIVHMERPCEGGFDTFRVELPTYRCLIREGFSDEECEFFQHFLQSNAHLLFRYAQNGGVKIA